MEYHKKKRASAGIAILIKRNWRNRIDNYEFINERIIKLRLKVVRGYITIVGVYSPEEGRPEEAAEFYEDLQTVVNNINPNDYLVIAGDLNARIGNKPIQNVMGKHGEITLNNNGKLLINFANFNSLKITNSFFPHKDIHKYTWNARGYRSIIDYTLVNTKCSKLVLDTRVFRGCDINSDHYLLISKLAIPSRWKRNISSSKTYKEIPETFKIHLLQEESIRQLYQNRLNLYLSETPINNNINQEWTKIKEIIIRAATEALGTRKKNYKRRGLKVWNEDMANLTKMKKDAYIKYLNQKTNDNLIDYKHKCAIVRREVRKIKRNSWDKYINDIECDIHGRQDKAYKILSHLCKKERDNLQLNLIPEETWLQYYQDLWTEKEETEEEILTQIDENVDPITFDELIIALNNFKNKKSPGTDNINSELIKYASLPLKYRLLDLMNICWKYGHIPEEWRVGKICPIYKKGDKKNCSNYRGISILNTCYKIYASILKARLNIIIENMLSESQNGFRKGRSCADCIFSINQIIEKHREHNLPTYMIFVDYEKAFDNVCRNKLWIIMKQKGIPQHLISAIKSLYVENKIVIGTSKERKNIAATINKGVRQGCPLSPSLFNIYIDKIVMNWQMDLNEHFKIKKNIFVDTLLFADDQVLISSSENGAQRALFQLNNISKSFSLNISINKTKVLAFRGADTLRAKIVLEGKIIEQINSFNYLGCNISYMKNEDIQNKINKFSYVCGVIKRSLKSTRKETKIKFYKVMAVPMLLYGSEFWILTKKEERRIEAAEMKFLRSVAGYTLFDRKRSEDIRRELSIFKLIDIIKQYRNDWKQHIQRMEADRIPKLMMNYNPIGRRNVGRPKTRWAQQC